MAKRTVYVSLWFQAAAGNDIIHWLAFMPQNSGEKCTTILLTFWIINAVR